MRSRVAVIPARYQSSRFPGKPLALIAGRPMLEHVWRACLRSGAFEKTVIATDDHRIAEAARGFGAEAVMTSATCSSGTDRVAEAMAALPAAAAILPIQRDQPPPRPDV